MKYVLLFSTILVSACMTEQQQKDAVLEENGMDVIRTCQVKFKGQKDALETCIRTGLQGVGIKT